VIVHGPAATVLTVEPATVHTDGVSELNDTASPDDACADRATGVPTVASGGGPNVIVCGAGPAGTGLTRNDRLTSGATWWASRAWWAVIVHVPTATVVTVEPATVHTGSVPDLKDTGGPGGDAVAVRWTGVPTVTSGGWSNVIVGAAGVLAKALTWAVSQVFCTFADGLVSW
jgi:hypothetical protein